VLNDYTKRYAGLLFSLLLLVGCGGGGGGGTPDDTNDTVGVFDLNPPLTLSETDKMAQIHDATRPYRYVFDNPVALRVATAPGRPGSIVAVDTPPVFTDPVPVYSGGYRAAFIEAGKDETRWFSYAVEDPEAVQVVWQVSKQPFKGDEADWKRPAGLIATGTVAAGSGEFSVDFSRLNLVTFQQSLVDGPVTTPRLQPKQQPYYVRAVAVDGEGDAVGDMGRGLEVLYGAAVSYEPADTGFVLLFNLLTPAASGDPYSNPEFHQLMDNWTEHAFNLYNSSKWYFRPEGFPSETDTLYLQVTLSPPGVGADDWRDPAGLVYEQVLQKGTPAFDSLAYNTSTIPIEFNTFAAVEVTYFVRAVALSPGPEVGTVKATYSKTVKFSCVPGEGSEFVYYPPPEPTVITPDLPDVALLRYEPIDWEDPEWMYWYEIVRRPTVRELTYGLIADDSLAEGYAVGDYFKLEPPTEEDKPWYEEAWDAVTDFFGNLVDYVSKVTDWVAEKYNSAKAYLVTVVAQNLPGVPAGWRDDLENALKYAVDYGLASVGIPPELPTFDQLTEQGLDYMASNALDMAGIPDTDLTNGMVQDLAGDMQETFSDAATSGNAPNPLGWNFVRQYPGTMYRPAYLLVEVHNPYGFKTPSGTLTGRVTRHVTAQEIAGNGDISTLSATFGGTHDFELYRPVENVRIPSLLPGQTVTVPVYLQEYTGAKYAFSPTTVTQNDFIRMYNNLDFFFSFRIDFDLPSAAVYADRHGYGESAAGFEYALTSRGFHFTGDPAYAYIP